MIYKILYNIGTLRRNPSLKKYYKFLKTTESWSIEQLEEYQFEKCKDFLCFVYTHSPFYKELFDEVGFNPSNFKSMDDLKSIPPISKHELLANNESIHTRFEFNKRFHSETSGTSGQPLIFYRNEEWDSHNRAAMFRGYSWYDVYPWERNGYLWGYNIEGKAVVKTKILDALQNRFRLFSYKDEGLETFAKKLHRAKYLHGYSSMIYEVAKRINNSKVENKSYDFKMIKGTSEKIYDSYHSEVEKAFGSKIISEYGAAESGLIAFECPYGFMHINMENVFVEEHKGEILVTNLLSRSFPIIRYKLGDSVKLGDADFKCKCGLSHPVILDVLGRVGRRIIGEADEYPSFTFYYVFKNIALEHGIALNYQALQNSKGVLVLRIEQQYDETVDVLLKKELKKYFSDDIIFEIEYNSKLHTMDGKLRDFITTM